MTTVIPLIQITLESKGNNHRQHNMIKMIEEISNVKESVFMIHDGAIPFKTIPSFESSVLNACRRYNKKILVMRIQGEKHRVMVFKS